MTIEAEAPFVAHLPGGYANFLLYLHSNTQLPADQLNLIVLLFIQSCIGSVYRRLQSKFQRQLYGLICGFFLVYSLYGPQMTLVLIGYVSLFYPIIKYFNSPRIIFWLGMSTLFFTFAYFYFYHYLSWRLDVTTSMMGIAIRVHTMSWDVLDGKQINAANNKNNKNNNNNNNNNNKNNNKNTTTNNDNNNNNQVQFVDHTGRPVTKIRPKELSYRMEFGCVESISLFDYFGYMFFFIHVLCGSNLRINEYLYLSDRTLFKRNGWTNNNKDPEPTWFDIIYAFIQVLITAGLYLFGKIMIPLCAYCGDIEFYNTSFWYNQWVSISFGVWFTKFKYHFGWKCLDLSCLTSGAAFSKVEYINKDDKDNKKVGKIIWNRARNINSFKNQFAQDTSQVVRNWNMTVNNWLTQYVFSRVVPTKWMHNTMGDFGSKVLITRLTSALFHGVYPGYWLFFFYTKFITDCINKLRTILPTYEDYKDNEKYSIKAISAFLFWWIYLLIGVDGFGVMFLCLETRKVIDLFNHIYWYPAVFMIFGIILGNVLERTFGVKESAKKKRTTRDSSKKSKKTE